MFQTLTEDKLKKTDVILCKLTIRDLLTELYNAWADSNGECFLFINEGYLWARGNKAEVRYAEGFIKGWRKALATDLLPHGLTCKLPSEVINPLLEALAECVTSPNAASYDNLILAKRRIGYISETATKALESVKDKCYE